jgi:hypothetical protein
MFRLRERMETDVKRTQRLDKLYSRARCRAEELRIVDEELRDEAFPLLTAPQDAEITLASLMQLDAARTTDS